MDAVDIVKNVGVCICLGRRTEWASARCQRHNLSAAPSKFLRLMSGVRSEKGKIRKTPKITMIITKKKSSSGLKKADRLFDVEVFHSILSPCVVQRVPGDKLSAI